MKAQRSRKDPMSNPHNLKPLKFLSLAQVEMIDEALEAVAPFGEVQLIVEKGRLRFVVTKNSHDALNWHPDSIRGSGANVQAAEQRSRTTR